MWWPASSIPPRTGVPPCLSAASLLTQSLENRKSRYDSQLDRCIWLYPVQMVELRTLSMRQQTALVQLFNCTLQLKDQFETCCYQPVSSNVTQPENAGTSWRCSELVPHNWPADLPFCLSLAPARFWDWSQPAPLAAMSNKAVQVRQSKMIQRGQVGVCQSAVFSSLMSQLHTDQENMFKPAEGRMSDTILIYVC